MKHSRQKCLDIYKALEFSPFILYSDLKYHFRVVASAQWSLNNIAIGEFARSRPQLSAKSAEAWHQKSIIECSFRLFKVLYPH